jgi:hypothetical protein
MKIYIIINFMFSPNDITVLVPSFNFVFSAAPDLSESDRLLICIQERLKKNISPFTAGKILSAHDGQAF